MKWLTIKIHDLPIEHPLVGGVSFHASKYPVERIWWEAHVDGSDQGPILEVITTNGEVWRLDFEAHQWIHTEDICT